MKKILSRVRTALGCIALITTSVAYAGADDIEFHDITPSSTIPSCEVGTCGKLVWPISELADGIIADGAPFNGFAGLTGSLGTISLDLAGDFDIDAFYLWNDINIVNEGVRSFRLDFFDSADSSVGSSDTLSAVSKFAANEYTFASAFRRVSRVDMVILGVSGRVEIREIGFAGAVSAPVPEPGLPAMFGIGLAAVALLARRTAGKT
jgi:hypothetical protein